MTVEQSWIVLYKKLTTRMPFEKKIIYETTPKRLFTFGCSFTEYEWASWANILGFELNKKYNTKFYNFGRGGAGNSYISNLISQVDQCYKFNNEDLVIVCWTSITREDRWKHDRWHCDGNIYSEYTELFDDKVTDLLADNTHFLMRDLANIKFVDSLLQNKTQYHFLSMKRIDDGGLFDTYYERLIKNYSSILQKIYPSYYKILWNNDSSQKYKINSKLLHKHYTDGHPSPIEHFYYLTKIFDYKFSDDTKSIVRETQDRFKKLILEVYSDIKEDTHPSSLPKIKYNRFYSECENLHIQNPIDNHPIIVT